MFKIRERLNGIVVLFPILMVFLTINAYFPGKMSPDSFGFLEQALTRQFGDMHPPIIAAVWRFLLWIWNNPAGLFCAQVVFYWGFWALLSAVAFREWNQQIFVLGIAALPPLWTQSFVIWTDSEFSISLLGSYLFGILAVYLNFHSPIKKKISVVIVVMLAILLFIYSAAIRKNSLPSLIPLAYFLDQAIFNKKSNTRTWFVVCGLCVFSLLAVEWINYGWLKAKKEHFFQLEETFDIMGVFSQTQRVDLIPPYWKIMNEKLTPEILLNCYTPYSEVPYSFWGDSPVKMTTNPECLKELSQKWMMAIRDFPLEFLHHRWEVYKRLLAIGEPKVFFPYYLDVASNTCNVRDQGDAVLQRVFNSYFKFFRNSLLFRGWFYFCLLLGLLVFQCFKLPNAHVLKIPVVCSSLSALLFEAGLFPFSPSAEFRFLYPVVTLFFLSLVLTFSAYGSSRQERVKKSEV